MSLTYTIVDLPATWPGRKTTSPSRSPFKTPSWTAIENLLDREIRHLGGRKVTLALELNRGLMDLRQDGMLRADARPGRALILGFVDRDGQQHSYPLDKYGYWQDNLYAIGRSLENLRAVERWGFSKQLTRASFLGLPPAGGSTPTMGVDDAVGILASFSDYAASTIRSDVGTARLAIRQAVFRTHPDRNGGERTYYDSVEQAKRLVEKHHGVTL